MPTLKKITTKKELKAIPNCAYLLLYEHSVNDFIPSQIVQKQFIRTKYSGATKDYYALIDLEDNSGWNFSRITFVQGEMKLGEYDSYEVYQIIKEGD